MYMNSIFGLTNYLRVRLEADDSSNEFLLKNVNGILNAIDNYRKENDTIIMATRSEIITLLKSIIIDEELMQDMRLFKAGHWIGGFVNKWVWDDVRIEELETKFLYDLFMSTRESVSIINEDKIANSY